MKTTQINQEVYYAGEQIVKVCHRDIEAFKEKALASDRKRCRLCTHKDIHDTLHEMLIVHTNDTYVRPHKHLGRSESFHIIEGTMRVIIFNDDGQITDTVEMGDYRSGKYFYYRLAQGRYHMVVITSDIAIFHEATQGPFERANTVFAPWAPLEHENEKAAIFMKQLAEGI